MLLVTINIKGEYTQPLQIMRLHAVLIIYLKMFTDQTDVFVLDQKTYNDERVTAGRINAT